MQFTKSLRDHIIHTSLHRHQEECLQRLQNRIEVQCDSANREHQIGCRDASKVPAVVEGMLGRHFYDFYFQREMLQEGSTNPTGNQWVRTGGDDRNNGDNPSPKKQKTNNQVGTGTAAQKSQSSISLQGGSNVKSAPAKFMADAQKTYKNLFLSPTPKDEETVKRKEKEKVIVTEEDDSEEDEGLLIGDIMCPSGDALIFSDPKFSTYGGEVRRLWSVQCNVDESVVINEYGSNMRKSKFDSLAAIEAKLAIEQNKKEMVTGKVENTVAQTESAETKVIREREEKEELMAEGESQPMEGALSPSPPRLTQEEYRTETHLLGGEDLDKTTCYKNSVQKEAEIGQGEQDEEAQTKLMEKEVDIEETVTEDENIPKKEDSIEKEKNNRRGKFEQLW